jgi:hypothetical protein
VVQAEEGRIAGRTDRDRDAALRAAASLKAAAARAGRVTARLCENAPPAALSGEPVHIKMLTRIIVALVVLALLVAGYVYVALHWSYSTGERAGWIQKLSNKGWLCKTWEGELALVSLPGSATVEKFAFTVPDDAVAAELTKVMGKRVTLHYEEKVGLPTSCFGETRHFVTGVSVASDISLSPGVVVQSPGAPASAASR